MELIPPDTDIELANCFLTESREYIAGAEAALLTLENDSADNEAVNTVFRAFHTIKGTAAYLGFTPISELSHRAETLLSRIRDKEIRCSGPYADLALQSVDMLNMLVECVQEALGGKTNDIPESYEALMQRLENPQGQVVEAQAPVKDLSASNEVRVVSQKTASKEGADATVRIQTERLDRLIDMVGELVIAQSMVVQDSTLHNTTLHDLLRKVTHSGKIVRELQDLSMSLRMVPLKATFQKMTRLVRDTAQKTEKLVELVIEGEDTEIDRHMVDAIGDPLVHMVRNAVDHGIESPDARQTLNKSRTGTLWLRAYHAGGNVVVELKDNGKGLDRDKILSKAIDRGLIEPDHTLSDSEIFNLIFAPGFSTVDTVTDLSGRGVGMDVVRRSIESLRGRIEIQSVPNAGTTFTIKLPLTLAITDGMLMRVGTERYILPTISIHMSFRPTESQLFTVAGRGEMVMFRNELMPLFRLHRLFNIEGAIENPPDALIVIIGDHETRCALLVDQLLGQQQFVAKPLGEGLGHLRGVSGGAIVGDGRVGLLLDPTEISSLARLGDKPNLLGVLTKSA